MFRLLLGFAPTGAAMDGISSAPSIRDTPMLAPPVRVDKLEPPSTPIVTPPQEQKLPEDGSFVQGKRLVVEEESERAELMESMTLVAHGLPMDDDVHAHLATMARLEQLLDQHLAQLEDEHTGQIQDRHLDPSGDGDPLAHDSDHIPDGLEGRLAHAMKHHDSGPEVREFLESLLQKMSFGGEDGSGDRPSNQDLQQLRDLLSGDSIEVTTREAVQQLKEEIGKALDQMVQRDSAFLARISVQGQLPGLEDMEKLHAALQEGNGPQLQGTLVDGGGSAPPNALKGHLAAPLALDHGG